MAAKKQNVSKLPVGISESQKTEEAVMPSKVRIMGRDITISKCVESEEFPDAGQFNEHALTIKVQEGQLPIEEADTLLHETIHAIDYWSHLDLTEHQVRVLATALIGLFQDHPDFAKFVTRPMGKN